MFLPMSEHASAYCSGLGSSDFYLKIISVVSIYYVVLMNLCFFFNFSYPQTSVLVQVSAGQAAAAHFNVYF